MKREETSERNRHALLQALQAEPGNHAEWRATVARMIADTIPEAELCGVSALLSAEEQRRRTARYDALVSEARQRIETGELRRARIAAEQACALDPIRVEAHRLLARLLPQLGDASAARLHELMAFHLGDGDDDPL